MWYFIAGWLVGLGVTKAYIHYKKTHGFRWCNVCHRFVRLKPFIGTFHICGGW